MTFDDDIPVLRIKMTGNKKSEYYSKITDDSFRFIGYDNIQTVEACTPDTIDQFHSRFNLQFEVGRMRHFKMDTSVKYWREWDKYELAIWYSHISAWHEVVKHNRPCMIVEHDCVLFRDLPIEYRKEKLLSFGANPHYNLVKGRVFYTPLAALGYYIVPELANRLIGRAQRKKIDEPVDGLIHRTCKKRYQYKRFTSGPFHDTVSAIHYIDKEVGTVKPKLYGKQRILKWEGDDEKVRRAKKEINLPGVRG